MVWSFLNDVKDVRYEPFIMIRQIVTFGIGILCGM